MEKKKRHIRNLLIDAPFQIRLLSYFAALFVVTSLCLYSTIFLFFYKLAATGHRVGIPVGHVYYKFLDQQKNELDFMFIGLALLNFILLLGVGFVVSHRIAGPLMKLRRYLTALSAESPAFSLRKKDFLKEFEPVVNQLRERVK